MSSPKSRDHINSIDSIPHLLICSNGYAETKDKKEASQECLRSEWGQGNFVGRCYYKVTKVNVVTSKSGIVYTRV